MRLLVNVVKCLLQVDARKFPAYAPGMDNERDLEARRIYLREGSYQAVADRLGVSKARAYTLVQRANLRSPLTWKHGSPEDQRAMIAYWRACMQRAGIRALPSLEGPHE